MTETDEIGIDLSWKSDLKSAWDARGDEFGPSEPDPDPDSSGVTIAGTTEDDLGEETTSLLPARIDEDALTEKQQTILEAAIIRPTATKIEVAAASDSTPSYVSEVVSRWLPDHPAVAADRDDRDGDDAQTAIDEWSRGGQA